MYIYNMDAFAHRRSGRHTHTQPCLRPHSWQIAGQGDTHTALPTRPHRWQIAGQGHTHTALPTRPHRWQIAGQGDTHTQHCLQDRTDGSSPVTHTHTAL